MFSEKGSIGPLSDPDPATWGVLMDLLPEWRAGIVEWARGHECVQAIWLFGSRATDKARSDSDIDLAIELMPADGGHDWALGTYFPLRGAWRSHLELIVGRHVSLEAIGPDISAYEMVHDLNCLLWKRPAP